MYFECIIKGAFYIIFVLRCCTAELFCPTADLSEKTAIINTTAGPGIA